MTKQGKPLTIKKVLVANRGEIAVRIFSTLKQMGIRSIAIYSEHDAKSQHRLMSDECYLLEGQTTLETYL